MNQQTLMDVFKFTDADLGANRAGKMTAGQKLTLRGKRLEYLIGYGLFATVGFIVFGACIVHFDTHTSAALLNSVMMTLISYGLFSVFAVLLVYKFRQLQIDLGEGYVSLAKGPISLRLTNNRSPTYRLEIGNIQLNIPQEAVSLLKNATSSKITPFIMPSFKNRSRD